MGDYQVAEREQLCLRDEALDVDMVGLRSKFGGGEVASDDQDEVDGLVAQGRDDRCKKAWRGVDRRPEGGVDGWTIWEVGKPRWRGLIPRSIGTQVPQGMGGGREG